MYKIQDSEVTKYIFCKHENIAVLSPKFSCGDFGWILNVQNYQLGARLLSLETSSSSPRLKIQRVTGRSNGNVKADYNGLKNRPAREVLDMSNDTPGSDSLGILYWERLQSRRAKAKTVHVQSSKWPDGSELARLSFWTYKSDITESDLRSFYIHLCNYLILKLEN